jgi:excinuclease ABC subunit C
MNLSSIKQKIAELPQNPGVYFFCGEKGKILYIGKATNLRSRVSSYFRNVIPGLTRNPEILNQVQDDTKNIQVAGRSEWISLMVSQVEKIDFVETDSVLEALILESNLIKKNQPKYNTLEKDDKSFSYFVITKEEFPRVLIVRKTDLNKPIRNYETKTNLQTKKIQNTKYEIQYTKNFGPYTSKQQMQVALKIIRRIFPFHSLKQKTEKGCLDFQIGMCPGPYAGSISKEDYRKNIRGIKMILEGKKKSLVKTLEKEMQAFAKKHEFEKAAELRNKIFALNHIRDVALMTRDMEHEAWSIDQEKHNTRIEAYDISNISGEHAVGSMVVFENLPTGQAGGKPNKNQYRKFKIKTVEGSNDVAMMREVLLRRFKNDWPMPDLVLLDGGLGHLNMAEKLLHQDLGLAVNLAAVAKGPTRKKLDVRISNIIQNTRYKIQDTKNKTSSNDGNDFVGNVLRDNLLLKSIMDEAHRFAITFHRKIRQKEALK